MLNTLDSAVLKQDLLYQALSSFPQAVCIIDEDCRFVFANEKYKQIPATEDMSGKYFWQVFPNVEEKDILEVIEDTFIKGEIRSLLGYHYLKDDGTESWWDFQFQPITTHDNKKFAMITATYVRDKYKSKQNLAERSYEFEHVIQSIGDPLVVFNQNMEEIYANKAFFYLIDENLTDDRTVKDWNQVYEYYDFRGKKLKENELPIQRALRGEFVQNLELRFIHSQDQTKTSSTYYYVSTSPIHLEGSDEKRFVMIMRDVSKELGQEKSRKDFIQIAAHELRTPLTAIKGFTQLVLERYKEREKKWFFQPTMKLIKEIERDQTFFKVIWDEALRLDQLTNELLSIFKIDQGKFEMDFKHTDISKITKEVIEEFVIPDDFHHIHYIDQTVEPLVKIDIKQMKRVIHNLLSNAVKYSPYHPDIYVYLEMDDNKLRLSVKDEGIGVPEEQQHRIFERFFRAYSPSHEEIHGYGIGLHICQEIMHQHGGEICFNSQLGEGSTFYFELPIDQKVINS